ncbi:MAG: aminomethyl-transferring glycine dehydrogenase subunit GcvPA [Acidobacteria bacterium]|nr:aminomethyl-transferring glycine dehydrogenase subunit GcvPA [Acidobacteriota bacterium]
MAYIPNAQREVAAMLAELGLPDVNALFASIPGAVRLEGPLPMPEGKSELEVDRHFQNLGRLNTGVLEFATFLGAGAYRHFVPSVIDALISRSEFFTAYTPYQPEISQGTLQAVFEYQSMVSMLTGLDVTNASMYDGATAVTEAVLMANRANNRKRVLVAGSLHPFYREVMSTYVRNFEIVLETLPWGPDGRLDAASLQSKLGDDVAAVVVQSPNVFGVVEDLPAAADAAHGKKALLVAAFTEALSLAYLRPPGECGADVAAGEGQSFGIPLSFGGPYLGIFSTTNAHVRRMPGRVVGLTNDTQGRRGFVLTLSTREQHIRREKATSNICTNEGLCALMASVYLSYAGRSGLKAVAEQNAAKAAYASEVLARVPGVQRRFTGPFFNEFVLTLPRDPQAFARYCKTRRIVPGVPLKWFYPEMTREILVSVTEMNTRQEIDALASALAEFCR